MGIRPPVVEARPDSPFGSIQIRTRDPRLEDAQVLDLARMLVVVRRSALGRRIEKASGTGTNGSGRIRFATLREGRAADPHGQVPLMPRRQGPEGRAESRHSRRGKERKLV